MRISDWSSDVCSSDLGFVTQQPFRFADIGLGLTYIARAKIGVHRRLVVDNALVGQRPSQVLEQLVQACARVIRHVIDLIDPLPLGKPRQNIGSPRDLDKTEIAAELTAPVNNTLF